MMYYSVTDTGLLGKKKFKCSYQESNLGPSITSSDAVPLSYRRLVGAKVIKLGSPCIALYFRFFFFLEQ